MDILCVVIASWCYDQSELSHWVGLGYLRPDPPGTSQSVLCFLNPIFHKLVNSICRDLGEEGCMPA